MTMAHPFVTALSPRWLLVTGPQLSVAVTRFRSGGGTSSRHWTWRSAGPLITGGTVSWTVPPVISGPADLQVQCRDEVPPPDLNRVTATDNCGPVTKSHLGDSAVTNGCAMVISRTYAAIDV